MLREGGAAGPRGLRGLLWALLLAVLLGAQSSAKKAGGASLGRVGSGEQQDLQSLSSQTLPTVAIYRLIGNDMPPLQQIGQLRWNTQYAMDYEVDFPGARKRWILNRIWNDTEFRAVYSGLIADGVHRRDILLRCFDLDTYATILDEQDKMLYLTSQNEGRNAGILDGRESGFEWSMILDGNTFITNDSWTSLSKMFRNASQMGLRYVKIPYHRLHIAQTPTFLTGTTSMRESLLEAPIKGESQIAFHKLAPELFTLGDTKPGESEKSKRRGYGQRNKSYMFKDGQICGRDSDICLCAEVPEGNEEQFFKGLNHTYTFSSADYTERCGLVLRLWNYPPENVIFTGLSAHNETGFFCFYQQNARDTLIRTHFEGLHHYFSECHVFNAAISLWSAMSEEQRQPFVSGSDKCKDDYHLTFLNSSCFRAEDRAIAVNFASAAIHGLLSERASAIATHSGGSTDQSTCAKLVESRKTKRDPSRPHHLLVLDETTLRAEQDAFRRKLVGAGLVQKLNGSVWRINPAAAAAAAAAPSQPLYTSPAAVAQGAAASANMATLSYFAAIIRAADRSLAAGALYSVTRKKRLPPQSLDRHSYYSVSPHLWPVAEVSESLKQRLEDEFLASQASADAAAPAASASASASASTVSRRTSASSGMDERAKRLWKQGYYSSPDVLPGSGIAEPHSDNYDRTAAWYMVDNVTTMALAWHLTNDSRYADWGCRLVRTWFINNQSFMEPKLPYAASLLDWKDAYFLLDAVVLLERSGAVPLWARVQLEAWCARLSEWLTVSGEGREAAAKANHHGLYFDLTVLSLSAYAFEEDMVDGARSRLVQRLALPFPAGHFAADGSQPFETTTAEGKAGGGGSGGGGGGVSERSEGLNLATLNLLGWLHAALAVDAVSANAAVSGVMPSLWAVRHGGRGNKVTQSTGLSPPAGAVLGYLQSRRNHGVGSSELTSDPPVLLKAIRFLARFLPDKEEGYAKPATPAAPAQAAAEPVVGKASKGAKSGSSSSSGGGGGGGGGKGGKGGKGARRGRELKSGGGGSEVSASEASWPALGVRVPFRQQAPFCFDRLLHIVQIGLRVYGAKAVFPKPTPATELAVKLAQLQPYSTARASFTPFSSVGDPSGSGLRSWAAMGMPAAADRNSSQPV